MTKKREQPVYEKLAPSERLIISRDAERFTATCNKNGEVTFKHVPYSNEPCGAKGEKSGRLT